MSENSYSFRTALGGFHRGDVSEYIASTAAAHQAWVEALEEEIAKLKKENEDLRNQLNELTESQIDTEEPELVSEEGNLETRELEAYRRAEAVERIANQRARKLYSEMQEICDSSMQDFSSSNDVARSAGESINEQLDIIRTSVESVFASLDASLDKLRAASQFSPDSSENPEED